MLGAMLFCYAWWVRFLHSESDIYLFIIQTQGFIKFFKSESVILIMVEHVIETIALSSPMVYSSILYFIFFLRDYYILLMFYVFFL